jgi:outer membrane receptor protein involved in Fe transport
MTQPPAAQYILCPYPIGALLRAALCALAWVSTAASADPPAAPAPVADAAAAPDAAGTETRLETVTVTAQKRSENIQEVPISITAVRGADLEDQHVTSIDDLSRIVPGVSFNSEGAKEGLTNIVIRGVSSTSGSATVGTYLDNVSITVKNFYDGAAEPKLVDLDRIEVLRGPQGTLFGDSSEGGTIRYITESPDMRHYGAAFTLQPSYTEHGGANFFGSTVLNVPVSPGLFALKGSFGFTSDSGWIDHYNYGPDGTSTPGSLAKNDVNWQRTLVGHLVGTITPGDGWTITPAFFYQHADAGENAAFYPTLGLWKQDKEVPEPGQDILQVNSLTVQKTLPFADLTNVLGLFTRDYKRQEDGTFYNSTAFAEFFLDPIYPQYQQQNNTIIANLPSAVHFDTFYHNLSEEFRISSPAAEAGRSPWKWVGGLYFADQKIHNTNFQQIPGINSVFQQIYGIPMDQSLVENAFGGPGVVLFPNDEDEADNRSYRERQYALFGQVDYDIRSNWHLSLGARYAIAMENFNSTEAGFYQIGNIGNVYQVGSTGPYFQSARFNAFNPKATLSYDINQDSSIYASAGKGFRLGGPTGPIVFGPTSVCNSDFEAIGQTTQPTKFGSDSLWTYELGSKNLLDDRHLTLNAAAFYTRWKNIQQQIYLPTCGYYFTDNVGTARIYGTEVESAYKVTRDLKLLATASYENSSVTETNNPLTVPEGAHLIDVPLDTYTLGAVYHRNFFDDWAGNSRIDFAWTGNSHGSYQVTNTNYSNPSYGVVNLSVGLSRSYYDFSVFCKNALDNKKIIQEPEINTVFEGYTVTPRVVGLMLSGEF